MSTRVKSGLDPFLSSRLVAEADKVVAYKTLTGTHRGTFLGVSATDKRVEFKIISIYGI